MHLLRQVPVHQIVLKRLLWWPLNWYRLKALKCIPEAPIATFSPGLKSLLLTMV